MTATLIESDTDVDTIVFDSVDLDKPCEAETPCDNRAEWRVRVKCCNNLWLLCQPCVDTLIEQVVKHKKTQIRCAKCKNLRLMGDFVSSINRL